MSYRLKVVISDGTRTVDFTAEGTPDAVSYAYNVWLKGATQREEPATKPERRGRRRHEEVDAIFEVIRSKPEGMVVGALAPDEAKSLWQALSRRLAEEPSMATTHRVSRTTSGQGMTFRLVATDKNRAPANQPRDVDAEIRALLMARPFARAGWYDFAVLSQVVFDALPGANRMALRRVLDACVLAGELRTIIHAADGEQWARR